jgi:hypothetical protein
MKSDPTRPVIFFSLLALLAGFIIGGETEHWYDLHPQPPTATTAPAEFYLVVTTTKLLDGKVSTSHRRVGGPFQIGAGDCEQAKAVAEREAGSTLSFLGGNDQYECTELSEAEAAAIPIGSIATPTSRIAPDLR